MNSSDRNADLETAPSGTVCFQCKTNVGEHLVSARCPKCGTLISQTLAPLIQVVLSGSEIGHLLSGCVLLAVSVIFTVLSFPIGGTIYYYTNSEIAPLLLIGGIVVIRIVSLFRLTQWLISQVQLGITRRGLRNIRLISVSEFVLIAAAIVWAKGTEQYPVAAIIPFAMIFGLSNVSVRRTTRTWPRQLGGRVVARSVHGVSAGGVQRSGRN